MLTILIIAIEFNQIEKVHIGFVKYASDMKEGTRVGFSVFVFRN